MKCLILASVQNERLAHFDQPAAFVPLLGVRLIERTLYGALQAGLTEFVIVTAETDTLVRQFLDKFARTYAVDITHVINETPDRGYGYATWLAREHLPAPFILMSLEYLFDLDTLKALIQQNVRDGQIVTAVDTNTLGVKTDWSSVIRVHSDEEGMVRAMRRGLVEFNAFDTGLYVCTPKLFEVLETQFSRKANATVLDGINVLVKSDQVRIYDIGENFWSHIDSPDAIQQAENNLLKKVNKSPQDNLIKRYVLRPLSKYTTPFFVATPLTLKQLSGISLVLSALAAVLLSINHYLGLLFGAVLALLAIVIHVSHEEVAILSYQQDRYVAWLDNVIGQYGEVLLLIGLMMHALHFQHFGINPILVGSLAIIGNLMFHYVGDKYQQIVGMKQPLSHEDYINRDTLYTVVFLGALLNIPLFALLIIMILFNAMVIRRLLVWKPHV